MNKLSFQYGAVTKAPIPDPECYRELNQPQLLRPWLVPGQLTGIYSLVACRTVVSQQCFYTLHQLASQCLHLPGEFWECGVFLGGTAEFVALLMANHPETGQKPFRLFDTFEGMPETSSDHDRHKEGDFKHDSWEYVSKTLQRYPNVSLHKGFIPTTFKGLEQSKIAFLHCDVDIYRSILDTLEFCYSRMVCGGIILFDDYGHESCPGAREAVDLFFAERPEEPIVLGTGQAFVVKL